jgi:hypothetical protein
MSSSSIKNRSLPSFSLFLILLFLLLLTFNIGQTISVDATDDDDNGNDCDETNIIIGTRTYTKGTSCDIVSLF